MLVAGGGSISFSSKVEKDMFENNYRQYKNKKYREAFDQAKETRKDIANRRIRLVLKGSSVAAAYQALQQSL